MVPFFVQTLASSRKTGTLLNTYTTAKSIINPEDVLAFQGGSLTNSMRFRTHVDGGISNVATTPGLIFFQLMMGSVVAWTSGQIQLNATAHTLLPFTLNVDWRVDSTGNSTNSKLIGLGRLGGKMFTLTAAQVDAVNTYGSLDVPQTAFAVGTGFNCSVLNAFDVWAGFTISNAGNGIQLANYYTEQLSG